MAPWRLISLNLSFLPLGKVWITAQRGRTAVMVKGGKCGMNGLSSVPSLPGTEMATELTEREVRKAK